jgi:prolyl 4-hydroxylase
VRSQSESFLSAARGLRANAPGAAPAMEALARAGDADALMMVGEFRLRGLHGPRNLVKGFRMVASAADKGQPEAEKAVIYLTAMGVGRKANPALARSLLRQLARRDRFAAIQDQLLDRVTCVGRARAMAPEVILADPAIKIWRGLFNEAEYGYLRHVANPFLEPAMIVDPATGQGYLDPVRNSDTTAVPMIAEDLIVQAIEQAIAEASGTRVDQGEALTILRYGPSQQYHPHYDAYDEGHPTPQRQKTALIWLNSEYEGGETHFPRLGLTVRGMPGDMLVFDNLGPDGRRDDRMEHAGLPVTRGEKWLASRWITVANLLELPRVD